SRGGGWGRPRGGAMPPGSPRRRPAARPGRNAPRRRRSSAPIAIATGRTPQAAGRRGRRGLRSVVSLQRRGLGHGLPEVGVVAEKDARAAAFERFELVEGSVHRLLVIGETR